MTNNPEDPYIIDYDKLRDTYTSNEYRNEMLRQMEEPVLVKYTANDKLKINPRDNYNQQYTSKPLTTIIDELSNAVTNAFYNRHTMINISPSKLLILLKHIDTLELTLSLEQQQRVCDSPDLEF